MKEKEETEDDETTKEERKIKHQRAVLSTSTSNALFSLG